MATLNVKNLPDDLYAQLQERARRNHRSVAQEVTHLIEEAVQAPDDLSILELEGLGSACWDPIDGVRHVEEERDAWD